VNRLGFFADRIERYLERGFMNADEWCVLATYASGFDADLAIAQLYAVDIPAVRDTNDTVGIFGPGFQGVTSRGVTVSVPSSLLDQARAAVTLVDDTD